MPMQAWHFTSSGYVCVCSSQGEEGEGGREITGAHHQQRAALVSCTSPLSTYLLVISPSNLEPLPPALDA